MQTKKKPKTAHAEEHLDEVDLPLLLLNLTLSYEERIERHEDARELLEVLRAAGVRAHEKSRKAS